MWIELNPIISQALNICQEAVVVAAAATLIESGGQAFQLVAIAIICESKLDQYRLIGGEVGQTRPAKPSAESQWHVDALNEVTLPI